jgi:anti-anti-sigma factor
MQFQVNSAIHEGVATLSLQGRFDFSQYSVFKEQQQKVLGEPGLKAVVLDLRGLDYLDSAALGIMLVLLDRAGEINAPVTIRNAQGVVREILDVAHFDRMFTIED